MNPSTQNQPATHGEEGSSLALLRRQRSHVLFVLSNATAGHEETFRPWYRGAYRQAVSSLADVVSAQHYEQHEVDVTRGRYPRLPFQYLGLYELSVDGAEAADNIISRIDSLHRQQTAATEPATWLYYPSVEKVGRSPDERPPMLTLAFANALPGQEAEFREWYATRHIRHALHVPALVSGQTFERTQHQRPGAMGAKFSTIAVYEQVGTPESMIESFKSIPPGTLDFPTMDKSRFTECVYRPL